MGNEERHDNDDQEATKKKRENYLFWAEIISLIISAVSLVLVVVTLSEMQTQRKSSYKPIISIANSEITTVDYRPANRSGYDDAGYSYGIYDFPEAVSNMEPFNLKLENVGLGTARNVEVIWDEKNFKRYQQYLGKYLYLADTQEMSYDEDGDLKLMLVRLKDKDIKEDSGDILLKEKISEDVSTPFLKPIESEDVFEVDATFFTHLMAFSEFAISTEDNQKAEIRLKVKYEDIYNKPYETSILLNYELENVSNKESGMVNQSIKILPKIEYSEWLFILNYWVVQKNDLMNNKNPLNTDSIGHKFDIDYL